MTAAAGREPLIPLVIGVTGHRTLRADADQWVSPLSDVLERIRTRLPHTPVVVLSALAEGADRQLARMVMARLDAQLVVPLPMPVEEYVRDFVSGQSQREFHSLLQEAMGARVVGGRVHDEPTARNDRTRRYAQAGAYVVEHSHLLIAVWDGQPARGPGGTADVVEWWRRGAVPRDLSPADEPRQLLPAETRPLIWANPSDGTVTVAPRAGSSDPAWDALDRLDELNADIRGLLGSRGGRLLARSGRALAGNAESLDPADGPSIVLDRYAAVDTAAIRLQQLEHMATSAVYATFAVSLMLYGLIDLITALVSFHVLSIPAIALMVFWAKRRRVEARTLDYRAVAEGLRVLYYWRAAGIGDRVSDSYLNRHVGVISWVRQAVAAVEVLADAARDSQQVVQSPGSTWVSTQRSYFSARRLVAHRASRRFALAVQVTSGLTLAVAVAYATVSLRAVAAGGPWTGSNSDADMWFQAALGFVGALAVVIEAYRKRQAFDVLGRQYALAERVFAAAERRLEEGSWPVAQVLRALGREALAENAEWLWMRRTQPLDVPHS